jgi:hypothetical protein
VSNRPAPPTIVYYRPTPPSPSLSAEERLVDVIPREIYRYPVVRGGRVREKFRIYVHCTNSHGWPRSYHYRGFTIILRHTTIGNTPLDKWSPQRWNLHPIRHNTHLRQASMLVAGFEPTIPASERPHTHALDRAANDSRLDLNNFLGIQILFIEYF